MFDRFGVKSGYKGPVKTMCLLNVQDVAAKKEVTDHLWLAVGKRFEGFELAQGSVLQFEARVTSYMKGYQGRQDEDDPFCKPVEIDYRLSFPSKVKKIGLTSMAQLTLNQEGCR